MEKIIKRSYLYMIQRIVCRDDKKYYIRSACDKALGRFLKEYKKVDALNAII